MQIFSKIESMLLKRALLKRINIIVDSTVNAGSQSAPEVFNALGKVIKIHVNELDKVDFGQLAAGLTLVSESFSKYDTKTTGHKTVSVVKDLVGDDNILAEISNKHGNEVSKIVIDGMSIIRRFIIEQAVRKSSNDVDKDDVQPLGDEHHGHLFVDTPHTMEPVVFFIDDVEICRLNVKIMDPGMPAILAIAKKYSVLGDAFHKVDVKCIMSDFDSHVCMFTRDVSGMEFVENIIKMHS